ncbi:hypothetical protein O3G_MSEX011872 [Manduca sexta]|uniref:C2H2-type domain-containing protein n=1 Tax=Manduca sexta TaxID=7130 RepID=A0A922CW37_MANSE|nr:hypothetical protein O3G_MSEX011872 [Manduca sexta]
MILNKSSAIPFRRHGSMHKCFFCEKCYLHVADLRRHTIDKHLEKRLYNIEHYITEPFIKLDITDLTCKLCAEGLETLKCLIKHLNKHHNKDYPEIVSQSIICFKLTDKDFGCLNCGKKFKLFGTLLLHIHCEHLDRKYVCEACGIDFRNNSDLLNHTQDVHSIGEYECTYCLKKFIKERRRNIHVKNFHESRRNCLLCQETFRSKRERDRHMYATHSQQMPWYKCDKCAIKFKVKRLLTEHIRRVHLKEKNVTCEICGMRFFSNTTLKLHKVRHSDAKPFECSTCNKKFPRKSALELHMRIHTNERRYVCKICGKAFIQWTSLQYHLPHHSDERNFKCVVCEKAFKTKKTMLRHCTNVHRKGNVDTAGGTVSSQTRLH